MVVWKVALLWLAMVVSVSAAGAPSPPDVTFERRTWSPVEGAPSSAWDIAQSADGLLWFASPAGLYRFDGERFQRVEKIYGHALASHNVTLVVALKQGIALAYSFGGVSVFSAHGVKHYDSRDGLPSGSIREILQTADGDLLIGTSAGMAMLKGDRWQLTRNNGLPEGAVRSISVDQAGTTWVIVGEQLYGRPVRSDTFVPVMQVFQSSVPQIVGGKILVISRRGQVVRIESGKKALVVLDKVSANFDGIYDGPLSTPWAWLGDKGGLVRLRQQSDGRYAVAEAFENLKGKNNPIVSSLVDREGNAWFGTLNGVERLRAQRIHEVTVPNGIFLPYVHRGLGDSMLLSGVFARELVQITGSGSARVADLADVVALWRDGPDRVWAGSASGLFRMRAHGLDKWPLPAGVKPGATVQSIAVDKAGVVWVSISRSGLYRFVDGVWTRVDTDAFGEDGIPVILSAAESGRVWMGLTKNRIGQVVNGKAQVVPTDPARDIGSVLSLLEIDGHLLAGGEKGLVWVDPRGIKPMLPDNEQAFRGVSGLGLDRQGGLWIHGLDGIFHISKAQLKAFWAAPGQALKWEVFSLADGVRGAATQIRPLPSLSVAEDGRIFYATNSQVGWIDPLNVRRNQRAPNVLVLGLRAGDVEWDPQGPVRLSPGTTSIEIKYAVAAMSIPEKVKIKYQLGGVDRDWQVPRGERVARYTNLEPGRYTFRVIAANEDGVWNNEGATLSFEILPEFWQAWWFRALVLLVVIALVFSFHRWRIASAAARIAERAAARLEERERIARSLHDNLLQGVQALILRSSTVLRRLPPGSQEERILESVLGQAEKLVEDTRDEVMSLRHRWSADQIVDQLAVEVAAMKAASADRLTLTVSGDVAHMRPEVAQEVCQVLKEALSNAVRHSNATAIRATLTVTAVSIDASVVDNGIGIAPEVALNGTPGHWGIIGMRERIAKLGGVLSIEGSAAGTTLRFTLE